MNKSLQLLLFFLIVVAPLKLSAQEEEEVILSSENIQEAENLRSMFKVKPRYRHIDSTNQRSVFLIAFRPEARKFPGEWGFVRPRARGMGRSLTLRYERLLKDYRFSVFAENVTRLHKIDGPGYDYGAKFRFQDSRGNNLNRGGEFDAYYSTFHLGAKFFYRQRERIDYGVSGINPFSEYFFIRVKDVLSYARRTTIIRSINFGLLEREVEEKKWIAAPGYIEFGWGIQRRVKKRFLVDFYVGAAPKLIGRRDHASRDVIFDVGLNIGFAFGKRTELK